MPYIGRNHIAGDHTSNFKVLDDISSYTATFDGSSTNVVSTTNETLRILEHRFIQGQRVTYTNGGGGNIGGLTTGTAYFVTFDTHNTIKLATSLSNANNNINVNLSSVGSGTAHTLNAAFDGTNTKFKLTHNSGDDAIINNATQLQVAINNVIQRPNQTALSFTEGFAIEDSHKIVFKTAPTSNDVFWGSIIANTIESFDSSDFKVDNFTGDGSTTSFTLSKDVPNLQSLMITLDGVTQHASDNTTTRSYSLTTSNTVEFTAAPGVGIEIQVKHLGFAGAATGEVSGFYGRTGNVTLSANDHITTGDITARNFKATGITTFSGDGTFGTVNATTGTFSGNISAVDGNFSGNVSIGGTLTYEDVTNIDSVGLGTFRNGIDCNGDLDVDGHTNLDNVSIAGVTTITSSTYPLNVHADTAYQGILVNGNNAPTIGFNIGDNATPSWKAGLSGSSHLNFSISEGTGNTNRLTLSAGGGGSISGTFVAQHLGIDGYLYHNADTNTKLQFGTDIIDLQTGGSTRLKVENSGVVITGVTTVSASAHISNANGSVFFGAGSATAYGSQGGIGRASNANYHIGSSAVGDLCIAAEGSKRILFGTKTGTGIGGITKRMSIASNGNVSIDNDLDVDGHTNLDNVSVAGVTTFSGNVETYGLGSFKFNEDWSAQGRNVVVFPYDDSSPWFSFVGTNLRFTDGGNFVKPSDNTNSNWGNIAGVVFEGTNQNSNSGNNPAIRFIGDLPGNNGLNLSLGSGSSGKTTAIDNKTFAYFSGTGHFAPGSDSTYDLGFNGIRWRNLYADTLYGDGSNLTGIAADKIFEGNTEVETVDTGSDGHIKFTTEGTERLRIDSSGNLMINSTSAEAKLDVTGGVSISSNGVTVSPSGYDLKIRSNTAKLGIHIDNASGTPILEFGIGGATGGRITTNTNAGPIIIAPNNVERLRIAPDGQVLPGADDAQNLGSSTKRWKNIYAADMHFSNEGKTNDVDGTWGDWTLQEGEDSVFMINNRTGKKYAITMREVN